jgi:phosphotransferase system  glucose/maltose/N-acetylglucosamine-specific IIC component
MARSIEILAAIYLGVIGLSHLLQPRAWVQFFILLRAKGEAGAFVDGFLHLLPAGIIIGLHNEWSGLPILLTLLGWALLTKSLLRFCLPKQALTVWARVSLERAWEFQAAGAGILVLVVLLGYSIYVG